MGVSPEMPERCPAPTNDEEDSLEPTAATLRIIDGAALDDAAPFADILTPLTRAKRSRQGERLFFLFYPTGRDLPHLCREIRDVVRETYWSTSGSVTAALRRSISVANRYLFEHNLNADRSNRCYGGLACAVLRGSDLFLLQAGPVWACILQRGELRCFPRGEKLAHIGIGPFADVRLHHVLATPGDSLLLSPHTLLRDASEEGLRRVLSLGDVDSMAAGLEQIGDNDFAALVAHWQRATRPRVAPAPAPAETKRSETSPSPGPVKGSRLQTRERIEPEPQLAEKPVPRPAAGTAEPGPDGKRSVRLQQAALALGNGLRSGLRRLGNALGYLWHGVAAAGAGMLALGKWVGGAIAATARSMLPGSEPATQRRTRHRAPPKEDRRVMVAIAAAIPIVILVVVLIAYREFAVASRLQGILGQAEEQMALAQAADGNSPEARTHWEQALGHIEAAATLQPGEPSTEALHDQAREALDRFDRIKRLTLTELADFRSENQERRLVLHGETLFVLDTEEDWAAQVALNGVNPGGARAEDGDGEGRDRPPVLMRTGQQVGGEVIGPLVDGAWVEGEEGRQSSALLVLTEEGQLISYDPAWRSASGAPELSLPELASPPRGRTVAVGSYQGRFYVLDATAEGSGQIWRYRPEGDSYPSQPERYFASSASQNLEQARDMAIDGDIYILYRDGRVDRFRGGETQPFSIAEIPDGLEEVVGFAVDPRGDGTVYIADRGNERIVVLGPDGSFQSQLRAEPSLKSLEALAVNQAEGRLYVLAAGKVYAGALP